MSNETLFYLIPPEGSERYNALIKYCNDNQTEVLRYLPIVAQVMINDGVEYDILFEYIRRNGGVYVRLGNRSKWFKKYMSHEAIETLKDISSPNILIPTANSVISSLRNLAIDQEIRKVATDPADRKAGTGLSEIARKYGMSARYIRYRQNDLLPDTAMPA
ncbi:MAG TPA: hypothetical protein ENI69_02490 [Rhodospirillales bacterium]|nr:hypothetical protein [Rhodospirillales bacterium]